MVQFRPTEIKESKAEKIEHAFAVFCHSLQDIRLRLGFVLLLCVFIGLGIPYLVLEIGGINYKDEKHGPCLLEHEMRIDCLPGLSAEAQNSEVCEKAGCCWEEFGFSVPNCFYPYPNNYSYIVNNVTEMHSTAGFKLQISPSFNKTSLETEIPSIVDVSVEYRTPSHVRILLDGGDNFSPYKHLQYQEFQPVNDADRKYSISLNQGGTFCINVTRTFGPRKAIFNTVYGPLIVSRGLTEVTTLLPSFNLYGIGQSPKNSFRHNLKFYKRYSLFSRMDYSNATSESFALSAGVHPFYLVMEENGFAHGVLLVSSVPVEIMVSGSPAVTFRTGDTRLDFHIFLGPTPAEVIRQLTEFVGRPSMPPYWALGYHSCRDAADLDEAFDYINYTQSQRIPHESDCGSLQIMNSFFDGNEITNLTDFRQKLKSTNRKVIMFQIPHVPFSDGKEQSIFLRNAGGGGTYEGYLPGEQEVCYPDFFNDITDWLKKKFKHLYEKSEGLFLDKNTPLNFNNSNTSNCSCCQMDRKHQLLQITNSVAQGTVCMGAIHSTTEEPHVYYHNMYGHANMMKVNKVLQGLSSRRTFLTSLSTFVGSGKYGGHWGGPIESTWTNLKQAITQSLDFSLFGIPLAGIPVCGSHGDFDHDLYSKWIQVSAFQPLMLSYRVDGQEPLMKLTSVGRRTIQLRYSLLPYLYSLFYNATKLGDTVIRPLMVEFPEDRETYGIDEQFMWGSGLMVSPNLKSLWKLEVYFPRGCWYDFYSGKNESESSLGNYRTLTTIKNQVNLHIRGGHIIPTQPFGLSTAESRKRNYVITIALNCLSRENLRGRIIQDQVLAYGELFIDDGYSELSATNFLLVTVTVRGRNVTIESNQNDLIFDRAQFSTILSDVRIYGMPEKPASVLVDDKKVASYAHNIGLETFMISNLNLDLRNNHTISWEPETYVNL